MCNFNVSGKFSDLVTILQNKVHSPVENISSEVSKRSADMDNYQQFLNNFPLDALKNLSLQDYCLGGTPNNNFCWWIEYNLVDELGRYRLGTAMHHLIYYPKAGGIYVDRRLQENLGNQDDALQYILKLHHTVASADVNNDLLWIDNDVEIWRRAGLIDQQILRLAPGRKLRLLSCYHSEYFIPISSNVHLKHFLEKFEYNHISDQPIARMLQLREVLFKARKIIPNLSPRGFMISLYSNELGIYPGFAPINNAVALRPINENIFSNNDEAHSQNVPLNNIYFGPPGTGKTYAMVDAALKVLQPDLLEKNRIEESDEPDDKKVKRFALKKAFDNYISLNRIRFVTFHQSFSYEDFVEGIRAVAHNGQLQYELTPGVFKQLCLEAKNDLSKPWVLIIDEINRGNISRIFGELITLIEPSKREGAEEALEVVLPYSKDSFSVPINLFIIATMNSIDRSLTSLDIALRRRFVFNEVQPNPELLKGVIIHGVDLGDLLTTMNKRIEYLLDRDHRIGHTYFINLEDTDTDKPLSELSKIFRLSILPLLQEYFFDDWYKIQLVLNDNRKPNIDHRFIIKQPDTYQILFGDVDDNNTRVQHNTRWKINEEAFNHIESYAGIINAQPTL